MLGNGGTGHRPWLRGVLRCGLLLAAVSLAVLPAGYASASPVRDPIITPAAAATPADPAASPSASPSATPGATPASLTGLTPAEQTLLPILTKLHTLYTQMETATQKYDALSEQLTQAQANVAELNVQVQDAQAQVAAGVELVGELASDQYRTGGISELGRVIFADNPQAALHGQELLDAASRSQAALLDQLSSDEAALSASQNAALVAQQNVATLLAAQGTAKDGINKQLTSVEQLVSGLTGAQQAELAQLEQQQANQAQLALLASGVLGKNDVKPSAAGAQAVAYAFAQLGKPYVWGGAGPAVFDCSGLTSQAWLHAGVPIPRTSEEQWAQLTHIPLNQLRPGDLILYFSGASHVAIYIGGGMVIQAPHPGAFVDIAPIAQNPILGAVRPDPGSTSLGGWTPPKPPSTPTPEPIGPVLPKPVPVPSPTGTPAGHPTGRPTPPAKPSPAPTGTPPGPTPDPTGTATSPSGTPTAPTTPTSAAASVPAPADTPSSSATP